MLALVIRFRLKAPKQRVYGGFVTYKSLHIDLFYGYINNQGTRSLYPSIFIKNKMLTNKKLIG
jgi:hypothetical protein